ncbi:Oxygen tolerance [compost metagenome]
MSRWLLALGALGLSCLAAAAEPDDWQASVELGPVGESTATLPQVLVPKQSVLMKVTVWMPEKVNWYPRYPQWDMPGATLLPLMMLSPSIERDRGRFTQRGATQNYLLTPLAEGALQLTPGTIRVYPEQADSPVLPFDPVEIQVALPDGAGSIDQFLPATALKATQQFYLLTSDDKQQEVKPEDLGQVRLQTGQMLERRITLEALGIQGNQIPPLRVDSDAVQRQSEAVDLDNYGDFTGGRRTEHWFYTPGTRDRLELQPLSIRWYDLGKRTFATASLAGGEIRAVAIQQADPRLQLSWWERLRLLSRKDIAVLVFATVLLGMLMRYRQRMTRWLKYRGRACRNRVSNAEPWLFMKACSLIALLGLESQRAHRAFQRWLLRAGATDRLEQSSAIQRWYRTRYAPGAQARARRLQVTGELLLLRRQLRPDRSAVAPLRYDLPELRHRLPPRQGTKVE